MALKPSSTLQSCLDILEKKYEYINKVLCGTSDNYFNKEMNLDWRNITSVLSLYVFHSNIT